LRTEITINLTLYKRLENMFSAIYSLKLIYRNTVGKGKQGLVSHMEGNSKH